MSPGPGGTAGLMKSECLVMFTLGERRLALPLSAVERVVHAVEITALPEAPASVLGVINVQGQILPVFNLRRRFRMPERELELRDKLILARTARRMVALVVDDVTGVMECGEDEAVLPDAIVPGLEYLGGVIKRPDGMIFIHNLDKFLSLEEERLLSEVLST